MDCCICGTVRNCGKYLDTIFRNMNQIKTLFSNFAIVLYYDHSTDNTLQKIIEYQNRNPTLITLHVNKEPMLPFRTHRIAKGRNKCLEIMKEKYNNFEYFIMMDCDDRCAYNIKLKMLQNYLKRNDWDSLSFNHPSGYYDSWALSKRPLVLSCNNFKERWAGLALINKLIARTPKNGLIKCLSAFNGFAIYRKQKFNNCHYDGNFRLDYIPAFLIRENKRFAGKIDISKNKEDCEHRFFHISAVLKNKARIRISPNCLFV